ncbi:MAG: hypothetical protein VX269_09720 [Verrucomicrobiota bacterium]|nr:hypothetical protein [Verrucomicrobiota bacterium]
MSPQNAGPPIDRVHPARILAIPAPPFEPDRLLLQARLDLRRSAANPVETVQDCDRQSGENLWPCGWPAQPFAPVRGIPFPAAVRQPECLPISVAWILLPSPNANP